MKDVFVKALYETIIEDGEKLYKKLYENTTQEECRVDYWKEALGLYHMLDEHQKNVLMKIVKQTMIDTVSGVFGVLDGVVTLSDCDFKCKVEINGIDTENELQDTFLAFVEENKVKTNFSW